MTAPYGEGRRTDDGGRRIKDEEYKPEAQASAWRDCVPFLRPSPSIPLSAAKSRRAGVRPPPCIALLICLSIGSPVRAQEPPRPLDDELLESLEGKPETPDPAGLDAELLEGLQSGEDVAVEEAGEDADPFDKLHRQMRQCGEWIRQARLGDKTQEMQTGIVDQLEKLIEEIQKAKPKNQGQPSPGSPADQTGDRDPVSQPGSPGSQSGQPNAKPATDSSDRTGADQAEKADKQSRQDLLKDVWGQLPERLRNQLQQSAGEEFLPEYELLIERYFTTLVQGDDPQP